MTAFFIPGLSGDLRVVEDAYGAMRRRIELDTGLTPSTRRILSVWTRRGAVDCVTEVGRRDPLLGGTVMAIFDLGRHQPFAVCWQPDPGTSDMAGCELLGPEVYSVLDFDA